MKIFQYIALLLLFISASIAQKNYKICINEFLAHNVTIDADIVDFDDYSDWIELYNAEDFDVDLGGYFLTDDPDNPQRWEIPPGTVIQARGFLRFWADGYDDIPGNTYKRTYYPFEPFTTDYYHLNFKLGRGGEFIGLYRSDGALVDSVHFGLQFPDVSRGRQPDGAADWFWFGEPTPQAANSSQGIRSPEYSGEPQISLPAGFYTGTQTITLSANSADAQIRYTLDGSRPVSTSALYETPIQISQTTVLRARVFEENKLPGRILTQTYFIDESIALPVVSIAFFPETFWDDTIGIYEHSYKEREVPVHFEFFTEDGESGFSLNAGLQLTGQASLYYPQKSFTIFARERFGADVINYQVFPQRELNNFASLYLRNAGVPDHRSTYFRDALQHTLVLNKMDIDCQAYLPAVVFLNGAYWGILNIRDKINSDYLASIYNINPDDIDLLEYEGSPNPTVMSGAAENYSAFYHFIETTDLSIEQNYRDLEKWMDVDEYINYQICEIFYDNVFWPDQNVRMWRERKEGAKWRWILFDLDFGFGMPNQISKGVSNNTLRHATSSNPESPGLPPLWATLIFRKLLDNDAFKTKFIQRFAGYLNSVFHPDTALAVINQLQNRLSPEMPRHISRWRNGKWYYGYPIANYSEWLSNVQVMKNFARNRPHYQRQHIADYFHLDGTFTLNLEIDDAMGTIEINDVERVKTSSSGQYFKNVPLELRAIPAVGYRFVRWQDLDQAEQNPQNLIFTGDSLTIRTQFEPEAIQIIPPRIYRDIVLTQEQSPYYARGNITVDSSATLRIGAGVEIRLPEKSSIIVNGRLLVEGTPDHPVIFRPNEQARQWGALCFVQAIDSSVLSHLKIIGATMGVDFTRDKAAISAYESNFSMHGVSFENVRAPVFVQYGKVSIDHCRFYTESAGDLINIKFAGLAVVENCEFIGNDGFDSDAIDFDHISSGIIRGNRIGNIYGFNSDAIDLGEDAQNILIENNIIFNVCDKGVSIGGGSTATVKRNVIANCGQGSSIKDFGSYGYFEHNTFYGNQTGLASFEKNIGRGGGSADVVNCIIANSSSASVFSDALSRLDISYSLSNTDVLPGLHNTHAQPFFLNDLRLAANSPAIDIGNPTFPADPDGSLPDLGAYPFDAQNQINLVINEIHYHPPEGEAFEFIELLNAGSEAVNLNGYRISGSVAVILANSVIQPGEYLLLAADKNVWPNTGCPVFQWESGSLPDGAGEIYLKDDLGNLIDFVNYDSRCWWPRQADGLGPSLELHHPALENMVSSSWRGSYQNGGTPRKSNNSVAISGIYINEFMAANNGFYEDENGEFDDWIEIYNATANAVNVGGFFLTDSLDNPCKYQIANNAPQLTTIPAGGFLLFWADRQADQGMLHLSFKLDRSGEQIGLAQICEDDTVFIDALTFGEQQQNVSLARSPDGSENWIFSNPATPLKSNPATGLDAPQPGPPLVFALGQNYPNPFNAETVISYQLSVISEVELSVYNILGQKVATLVSARQPAGSYKVEWDASCFASGVYLYRLEAGKFSETRKLIILK